MLIIRSGFLGLLALLLTACQTHNSLELQDKFVQFERSSRVALQQNFGNELQLRESSLVDPVNRPDTPNVNSMFDAQQLALQHSPRVAAILLDLGIHEAETIQNYIAENPGFELSLMRPEHGGRWEVEVSLSLGLLSWLSRHTRQALSDSESSVWQMQAWQLLSDELTQVRHYWLQALASKQKLDTYGELYESAKVAADFAQLLFDAGNISELELLGSQSIAAQRRAQHIQAQLQADKKASDLQLMLGLTHVAAISLPDQLPEVEPILSESIARQTTSVLELAQQHQPALLLLAKEQQKNQDAWALALRQIGLRQSGVELVTERKSSGERQLGFGLSLAPPVFDKGDAELAVLQGRMQRTLNQQQLLIEQTASQIQNALLDIQSSLQQVDLLTQDELPRYQRMMALSVLEYNFMLRGTFDLLAVADRVLDAKLRQVDAIEQYWRARSTLENLAGSQDWHSNSGVTE